MSAEAISLLLVRMGGRPCALPCQHIVEIVPRVTVEKVPGASEDMLGVINVRGRVVPVIDIRHRIAGTPRGQPYQHCVILSGPTKPVGLVVDEVKDVLGVAPDAVERPGEIGGRTKTPGVVRIQDELVLVLEPDDVVSSQGS